MGKNSTEREQAIATAIQVGRETYGDIGMFEIAVDEDPTHWYVNFSDPQALEDGERQHFSVRIDKETGTAQLFKGR